ncbi:hypothetical protein PA25_35140 [Pseudoalteromonas sp. A25]|nr:hypothetical protein PA25_35140 [Pseudoalteromonas sp. A25]
MKTHETVSGASYFDSLEHALCAYHYAKQAQRLKDINTSQGIQMAKTLLQEETANGLGYQAQLRKEKVHFKLACLLEKSHPELAIQLLEPCESAKSQEKRIRLLYSQGESEYCKQLLYAVLKTPNDEHLLLFAKDFLLRKYGQKRTSILTDLLNENEQLIAIDEAYKGNTEKGVIDHYFNRGIKAWHTENRLWLALFSLVFWQELYDEKQSMPANEFERYPQLLKLNRFYDVLGDKVELKLEFVSQLADISKWLLRQASLSFGKPNPLFQWSDALLNQLFILVKYSSITAIVSLLRAMSKDFQNLKDGYPDLMVLERENLRFEEVKAPGDALRRNQLVSINRLSECGFAVTVQRTSWQFDPNQTYVVVDLETTGGKKETDRITEVGLVKVKQGKIVSKWQSLVNPQRHIPKYITQLTGIDNEMVATAPSFGEIAETVREFCENAIFVAHNVNFDMGFLKYEFQRLNIVFSKPKLCTVQLARKYLPGYPSYSLGSLCSSLEIDLHQHHRALDDAMAAAKILLLINNLRGTEQVVA